MFAKYALFAAGIAAVARAAPMPQQAQTTDWQAVWSSQQEGFKSQLASMVSVQEHMGKADPTGAAVSALSSQGAVPTGSYGAAAGAKPTTTVLHTSTIMASVTSTLGADGAQVTAPAGGRKEVVPAAGAAQYGSQKASSSAPVAAGTTTKSAGQQATPSSSATNTVSNAKASTNAASGQGPSVTNSAAWNGQASSGPTPVDAYKCYGDANGATKSSFPSSSGWSGFDALYQDNNRLLHEGCANLGYSPNNNDQQIGWIKDAISQVASDSKVDPRVILATVMQESHGCLAVGTTSNGVTNPGLMQSHNGATFVGNSASADQQKASIVQMIRDGTQGTASGDGLVQLINRYGDVFTASRAYNSGDGGVTPSNLNRGNGATATYVEDIANRLTGWSLTPGTSPSCPGEA